MKLNKVRVTKYKCVEDSDSFRIDQVTCLVGKNEAGKSALLEALYKLNPVDDDAANFVQEDYPRRFALTDEGKRDQGSANVLTTAWDVERRDLGSNWVGASRSRPG